MERSTSLNMIMALAFHQIKAFALGSSKGSEIQKTRASKNGTEGKADDEQQRRQKASRYWKQQFYKFGDDMLQRLQRHVH
jgi:hypothetical protein